MNDFTPEGMAHAAGVTKEDLEEARKQLEDEGVDNPALQMLSRATAIAWTRKMAAEGLKTKSDIETEIAAKQKIAPKAPNVGQKTIKPGPAPTEVEPFFGENAPRRWNKPKQPSIVVPPTGGKTTLESLGQTQLAGQVAEQPAQQSATAANPSRVVPAPSEATKPTVVAPRPSAGTTAEKTLGTPSAGTTADRPSTDASSSATAEKPQAEKAKQREQPRVTPAPKSTFQDRLFRHLASAGLGHALGSLNLPLGLGGFAHQELMGMMFPNQQTRQRDSMGRFTSALGGGGSPINSFLGGGLGDILGGGGQDEEARGPQKEILEELVKIREAIEELVEKLSTNPRSHPESPGSPAPKPSGGMDMNHVMAMVQGMMGKGGSSSGDLQQIVSAIKAAVQMAEMAAVAA
jgi:hypothetical protein